MNIPKIKLADTNVCATVEKKFSKKVNSGKLSEFKPGVNVLDISAEENGYFLAGGKYVKIFFPR